MPVSSLSFLPAILCLAAALALFGRDRHEKQIVRLRMQKLRGSLEYEQLYYLLRAARDQGVETVIVHPEAILIRFIESRFSQIEYNLHDGGLGGLGCDQLFVLACLVGEDMIDLAVRSRYRLLRHRQILPSGYERISYEYRITLAYRAEWRERAARRLAEQMINAD